MAARATSPSQRAHTWFAEAKDLATHSTPAEKLLPHSLWASQAMYTLQTLALPLAFWFKPVCVCVALVWLTYRAYQVINKPLEELASLLGFDIPLTPVADLAGIKADGAVIHWSLSEKQKHKSTHKYEVHVNGNVIDTVGTTESAVTITGLQPASFYVVRIALVNSLEFSSKSAPLRFRTKGGGSGDFYQLTAEGHETDQDGAHEAMPRARPYRGLKDITLASPDAMAPPMMRENSMGGRAPKRSVTGHRPSPVLLGLEGKHDPGSEDSEPPEGAETIQQLTEKLDFIRRETDEAERQAKDEEEEESRQKEDFIRERDDLKAEVAERDKANRNMKREVNILERQNTAAQNERSKHERILAQKLQEREKLKEDTIRWEKEAGQIKADTERLKKEKEQGIAKINQQKEELREKQAVEAAALKSLDEEIREKTTEIKKLERATKNNSPNSAEPDTNLVQQMQRAAEEDQNWGIQRYELQQQYGGAVQALERAKALQTQQVRYLESVRAERRRQDEAAAASAAREMPSPPAVPERPLQRGNSERSRTMNGSNESPRMNSFPAVSSSPFGGSMNSTAFTSAPFLNMQNGMTIIHPVNSLDMTDEERERLTGGAPMSPGAGENLLPTDLFSGDDSRPTLAENVQPLPGLGSLPGLGAKLPGLGQQPTPNQDFNDRGPASPSSVPSRSPSVFASPRGSQNNLYIGSPENNLESDHRSIHSTRSNRAVSGTAASSRFSSMFGIKPRAKNASMDDPSAGPPLGKAHSHSMPRQDQGVPGLDSAVRKRNSSISGGVFGGVLSRPPADREASDPDTTSPFGEQPAQHRRIPFSRLNPFTREKGADGWPSNFILGRNNRPASPRPGSTHSSELPRPSFDSSRWGVADAWPSESGAARSSPLSTYSAMSNWNPSLGAGPSRLVGSGSRHASRRPSVQHASSSGPVEDILEDSDSDALPAENGFEPHLAPIGTKPPPNSRGGESAAGDDALHQLSSSEDQSAARLNPNAKDFKSFFPSMRLRSSKDKDKSHPSVDPHSHDFSDTSPDASRRKSRDARHSTTTLESSLASESLRASSTDLARTPSYSNTSDHAREREGNSPLVTSGSWGKESLMSRISRKSSSGKFSLPNFGKVRAAGTGAAELEDEDLAGSGSGGKALGSVRSWSNVLKLGKKRQDAMSVSEASGADEEEEGEREGRGGL